MRVRKNANRDIPVMIETWNEMLEEGEVFAGHELFDANTGDEFFTSQTYCGVAVDFGGNIHGLYGLKACEDNEKSAEAVFVVRKPSRGQKIGQDLLNDCLKTAEGKGITEIILREVEPGNEAARHLFEKAGFASCGENTYRKDL